MSYMNNNETAIRETTPFVLPAMMENGFAPEDLGDDFDGLQLSFKKLKIPAGGVLQFEEPGGDPENPDYVKTVEGIIVFNHATNAFWAAGSEYDENSTPLCSSFDGKTGCGIPGGACALCEMNKYGTDQGGGKGKACKNMRTLYILRNGEAMPIQLSLPPTSLRPYTDFANAVFATRRRPVWSAIVRIGLKRVENGSNTYSVATFSKVRDLTPEEIMAMRDYATAFRAQAKEMLEQRAQEAANRASEDDAFDGASAGSGQFYAAGDLLNGDDGELPM